MNENMEVMEPKNSGSAVKQGLKLGFSLFLIAAVAAFVLALVNAVTADTIARHAEEKRQAAMAAVMPGANVFSEMYSEDTTIDRISGAYKGTTFLGYCVEVTPNGFGGAISLMVGVDANGSVTGASILDHSETAGLGSKAADPAFLDQYIGKSGSITVNTGTNAIQAITGATVTSKAVTQGINTALTAVLNYDAEGGLDDDGDI